MGQKLCLGLPHGGQGPKQLSHHLLSPIVHTRVDLEVQLNSALGTPTQIQRSHTAVYLPVPNVCS